MPCINFLELIWLLHVIVCDVYLGFKTEKSRLACYYLNECHAEFFGTNLVIACYCMCCFFWVLRLKIQVGLLLLE